ncbi:helix-turn-helix domain-containing protein [Nonomuraea sp. NPDC050536]|uniref:helix-turn-helix domain-containing protein n=1 Tax=Nonomuraea sp. NPDC050536 TaxID=3364366 RepID=UPI0037C6A8DC
MIAEGSPTLRRRKLAAELRRLREDVGLNGVQVAKALRWSTSKISRMENGQVAPTAKDVEKLLKHYGAPSDLGGLLLSLVDTEGRAWWDSYADVLSEPVIELFGMEAGAVQVKTWHATLIPGLLQTRAYAAQLGYLYQSMEMIPPKWVDRRVEARMRRQRRLTGDDPLRVAAVLEDSVLERQFGRIDETLMADQLRHLVKLSELPNVTIRVLKLDQPHPLDINNFMIMSFPSVPVLGSLSQDVIYFENYPPTAPSDDEQTVYQYSLVFDRLLDAALDDEASREFIASLAGM